MQEKPVLLVFVKDMIFRSRISAVANECGVRIQAVRSAAEIAKGLSAGPVCGLIVDLNSAGAEMKEVASAAAGALPADAITAFYSHVDTELAEAARALGLRNIMPRSRFVSELPEMIAAFAGGPQ